MTRLVLLCAAACLTVPRLAAQQPTLPPPRPGLALASRADLTAALARLDASKDASAQTQARLIRARLENGDFQAGDRIALRVEGELVLSDTFTVHDGPALDLPQIGSMSLAGVLRSELTARVETHLARYLRSPVLSVKPLVRILIEGDVARPGFYAAAPQQPLADVITQAGGLSPRANPNKMTIARGSELIWAGGGLRDAMSRGASIDQLNLRAGDRLHVPSRGDSEKTWRIIGIAVTLPLAIYSITRIR